MKHPAEKRSLNYARRLRIIGFLFVLPAFLYFVAIYYFPLFEAFRMSLLEMAPGGAMKYVGLASVKKVFADPLFWRSLVHTIFFMVCSSVLTVILGIIIAIGLYGVSRSVLRNMFILAYVLPTLVSLTAAGFIWEWIYHPRFGLINYALSLLGFSKQPFLADSIQVLPSLIIINVWVRIGFAVLIFFAGLLGISSSYFDAAKVDGATGFTLHKNVTIPLLLPQITVVTFLEVIFGFKVFDVIYVSTQGGPNEASYVLMLYLYNNAFRFYHPGRASVVAVFMFIFLLIFSLVQRRVVKGRRYEI
ncbi:ABC transporter permease subunit [candidate division KSB3 bacterium]|uniref:ABC transporter permease subunit n=1 Tax=candidate division KSB3 bacterium TaxID=2044937 RepID=A0A9D5K129_9BACT|nr:ABC transporter permease subunit [candidate division KSB3 bacterium]MBD3327575.1 ABC transporter permease subunit [candidate division KSB3 bacterium]